MKAVSKTKKYRHSGSHNNNNSSSSALPYVDPPPRVRGTGRKLRFDDADYEDTNVADPTTATATASTAAIDESRGKWYPTPDGSIKSSVKAVVR